MYVLIILFIFTHRHFLQSIPIVATLTYVHVGRLYVWPTGTVCSYVVSRSQTAFIRRERVR